jgi:hypothetical protein
MAEVREVSKAKHLLMKREVLAKEAEVGVKKLKVEEELSIMHQRAIYEEKRLKMKLNCYKSKKKQ